MYINVLMIYLPIFRGGLEILIGPGETENSAQFWHNNKIFTSYRPNSNSPKGPGGDRSPWPTAS